MTPDAPNPLDRLDNVELFNAKQLETLRDSLAQQLADAEEAFSELSKLSPAVAFAINPLWVEAGWRATTFQWHPTSDAPPIMGLVFDNADAGQGIFAEAAGQLDHNDAIDEIRLSIIEGPVPGQERRPGYSVHIYPDPESLAARATAEDFVLDAKLIPLIGQWNRHYPIPGNPPLLPRFKREFAKHKEFLLAPVTRRYDGQLYADVELGIVKKAIRFRNLSEITPDDPDAAALALPQLITPPM